jgi:hypothetical protein
VLDDAPQNARRQQKRRRLGRANRFGQFLKRQATIASMVG